MLNYTVHKYLRSKNHRNNNQKIRYFSIQNYPGYNLSLRSHFTTIKHH